MKVAPVATDIYTMVLHLVVLVKLYKICKVTLAYKVCINCIM